MKTVLVIGANGQLGSCIQELAKDKSNLQFIFTDSDVLDITDKNQLTDFFSDNKIDYCVNCAAYTAVDKAESDSEKAFLINATGAKNIAEVCKKSGAILIHISTDFIFDGIQIGSYIETDVANPLSVYGKSKLDGETNIINTFSNYFIIRTSWLYSEYGANFMKTMLRLGNERDSLSVVSDQIGVPTYAKDLAEVILNIIENNVDDYGIYHYCNRGKTSWFGFASAIFELSSIDINVSPIKSIEYPTPAERPRFSVLCQAKITELLGIEIPYWKDSLKTALGNLPYN